MRNIVVVEDELLALIASGNQAQVSELYGYMIRTYGDAANYRKINAAIQQRWKGKSALPRIKEKAWKLCAEVGYTFADGWGTQHPEVQQ